MKSKKKILKPVEAAKPINRSHFYSKKEFKDEEQYIAWTLAVFSKTINPAIHFEKSVKVLYECMKESGFDLANAEELGVWVRMTADTMESDYIDH